MAHFCEHMISKVKYHFLAAAQDLVYARRMIRLHDLACTPCESDIQIYMATLQHPPYCGMEGACRARMLRRLMWTLRAQRQSSP